MAAAMKVSLKTENEEYLGKTVQIRGSEGGRRSFTGTSMQSFRWHVPRQPSARLTHGLKLDTVVWLLRCSVLRETSMAFFCDYFKRLNCYMVGNINNEPLRRVWDKILPGSRSEEYKGKYLFPAQKGSIF